MNKISIGLSLLELGIGLLSTRARKRQALRDKYDKIVEEENKNEISSD